MVRILILVIVEAAAILLGSKCVIFANDTPDGGSAALFLLGACFCTVAAVAVLAVYFGARSAFIALLLLAGCIGSVEATAHMNRRLAAVEYEQEQRYELSGCRVTSPPDPNGLFGRVTMRCTMGKGTRWEEREVLVFLTVDDNDNWQ